MNEFHCSTCDVSYEIIHDETEQPCYCPFCGIELEELDDDKDTSHYNEDKEW